MWRVGGWEVAYEEEGFSWGRSSPKIFGVKWSG